MNKFIKRIVALLIAVICSSLFITICFADDDIKVVIDGNEIIFDVKPMIIKDRTMVPMRKIFESFGLKVDWNEKTQVITGHNDDKLIELQINSAQAYVNNEKIILDVPAIEVGGSTLVPLRFIAESLGIAVRWNNEENTAVIDSKILYLKLYDNTTGEFKYQGEVENGLPNGIGKEFSDGMVIYFGQWKDGEQTGIGKIYDDSGDLVYEGELINGVPNGYGTGCITQNKSEVYDGIWVNGNRKGFGKMYFNGVLSEEGQYDEILLIGKVYNQEGNVFMEYNLTKNENGVSGTSKIFYNNGKLLLEIELKDGKRTENSKLFDKDGNVIKQGEAANNLTYSELSNLINS